MAENDIIVPKENAAGGFDEVALAAADIGAAPAVNVIELTPNGTTTITTAQLPARGIAYIEGGASFTVNLPTPDKRQSGLTFSIKVEHEGGVAGDVFITVVHDAANLLTAYELDEDAGSIDFRWDGYRWTLSFSEALVVRNANDTFTSLLPLGTANRNISLPDASGTIARTEDFAAPPAIGNTTPAAVSATTLDASTSLTLGPSTATLASPAVLFAQNGRFSCTGTASDDVITATGHNFANGDDVSFVVLTGGSGLNTATRYFVRDVSGDTFKIATTAVGAAVNFTTDITDGVINRVVGLRVNPSRLGYIMCGEPPDSAVLGGNPRGLGSVDWQHVRAEAIHSASGQYSVIAGGVSNRATARGSACVGGEGNLISGGWATGGGVGNSATGANSVAFGDNNSATATSSSVLSGERGRADRYGMQSHGAGMFAAQGDAQRGRFVLRCKTTTNAAVEMALDGSATYLTIPSGKVIFCNIKVVGVKSDGSTVATYERQYAAKNVAGTSSEVYAAVTIGTDNASSTSLEIATVDAGDYIRIRPTGIASETWRWVASVDAVEVAYGS